MFVSRAIQLVEPVAPGLNGQKEGHHSVSDSSKCQVALNPKPYTLNP